MIDGRIDGLTDGRTDGHTTRQTDRHIDIHGVTYPRLINAPKLRLSVLDEVEVGEGEDN